MSEFDENNEVLIIQYVHYQNYVTKQVTDEEKLQIAQHYLLSSPPGQFQEVLNG